MGSGLRVQGSGHRVQGSEQLLELPFERDGQG